MVPKQAHTSSSVYVGNTFVKIDQAGNTGHWAVFERNKNGQKYSFWTLPRLVFNP